MTALIIILTIILLGVIIVQIGKVNELASKIRGEEVVEQKNNRAQGNYMLLFMIAFLILSVVSAFIYKNYMLGYGPHAAASAHGGKLDSLFNITLFFTGIIFILTHIALFYFTWKYKSVPGRKAVHWSHNNMLEIVWSVVPAIVMTFLVIKGLIAWNEVMADVGPDEEVIEIGATGYQFAWHLRYPGPDGVLGERNFKLINGLNPIGQDWTDEKNLDDFHPDEIVLPVGKKVRVRINSRDVLHNFYLPHFRVKMDAVPGIPTYFVFTPTKTTEDYRLELSKYEEYNVPTDPTDPESNMLWEDFNYELACAELCGASHFSMRRTVRIVSESEYEDWLATQQSYYMSSIRNTSDDPFTDRLLDVEIRERKMEFNTNVESALNNDDTEAKIVQLVYVNFETGSAELTPLSRYELDNLVSTMKQYPNLVIEVNGHTDNTGNADSNLVLSQNRADAVKNYVVENGVEESRMRAIGYGQNRPVDTNDTEAGRANNRRTEFKIIAQ
jgi:cytochrome c oxidase subunit 2